MSRACLVDGVRTRIGRYAGASPAYRPGNLVAHARRELATTRIGAGQGIAVLPERAG